MATGYDAQFYANVASIAHQLETIAQAMNAMSLTSHRTALALERLAQAAETEQEPVKES